MEKDNFNANVDFVRGQADMIVLSALSDSDKYGLEILSAIQERSQGMYSLKQATLYSSLKRLEKNGYVHSYDGDISNGAKRVYYGLTEVGREHLENDKSYWEFCNFLMSNLISDNKFDPQNENKPFDPADFRPLTRRSRSEKDDKDQEKEVVVKYVYVKSDENIPEGADVVYSSPDNSQDNVNNESNNDGINAQSDAEPDAETEVQEDSQSETQQDATLLDAQSESESDKDYYQPSFVLVDEDEQYVDSNYDFSAAESDNTETGNVENEVSILETHVQVQEETTQVETVEQDTQVTVVDETEESATDNVEVVQETSQTEGEAIPQDTALAVETQESAQATSDTTENAAIEESSAVADSATIVDDGLDATQETPAIEEHAGAQTDEADADSSTSFSSIFTNFTRENDVNYVESFSELFDVEDEEDELEQDTGADIEFLTMKEMVYKYQAKGITIKPYEKRNTMEYYVNRYYFSNKLQLHASLIIFAIFAVELFIAHFICNRVPEPTYNKMSNLWLLIIFALAIFPAIRGVMYVIDPTRKSLANYNPKTSILISLLPVVTLPIVFSLIAFVKFGARVDDYLSMERSIILPSVLLFNIPLFSLIYTLLYRTYKYHVN